MPGPSLVCSPAARSVRPALAALGAGLTACSLAACSAPISRLPSDAAAVVPAVDAAAAPAASSQGPTPETTAAIPELGRFGIDLTAMDPSVAPGDDFFAYANGAWLDSYEFQPDESWYGSLVGLQRRSERRVRRIIEELRETTNEVGSPEQQVVDYYRSFMDEDALEARGIRALAPELDRIAAITDRDALVRAFGRSGIDDTDAPIDFYIGIDPEAPDRYILNIVHSGLGLPDRSYYLAPAFAGVRDAYLEHIATMLGFAGYSHGEARRAADRVLSLETAIARHHWPREELRDDDRTWNPRSLVELERELPGYPWRRQLEAAGIDTSRLTRLNLTTPDAMAPLIEWIDATPLATWRAWLAFHLLANQASLLGPTIERAAFDFYGTVLGGQPEQRARWKRGVSIVGSGRVLGEAVGRLYVERWFPPQSKQAMQTLVDNLRAALGRRIERLAWMSADTRAEALAKLAAFRTKIGYPDKWRDFSSIEIRPDDLMANDRAVRAYWYADYIGRLDRPTDREEWGMPAHVVNAYYNTSFNEIVFPAAILQAPFFDPAADPAVNYGAIGAVIGHEMGHGFDDQGSKSDHAGVKRNWWSAADRARFEARTRALVEQYDRYEPLPGHPINGQLTLGENIGDLGGLSMALEAWQHSLGDGEAAVIEGFTGTQRFFLAWAQVWRSKYRDQHLLRMLQADPHSPAPWRVNGVVRNMDAFYEAFGAGPDDALWLAPPERVRIW
jgi:putative endopeptidase